MITVGDLRELLSRPSARARGLGSPQGDNLRAQADALDASGQNGSILRAEADQLDAGFAASLDAPSAAPASGASSNDFAAIAGDVGALGAAAAQIAKAAGLIPGPKAPAPRPAPSAPWTTGEKIALGVALGVPAVGLGAYALGAFSGPKRRRSRR